MSWWTENKLFPKCFRDEMQRHYSAEKSALIFSAVRSKIGSFDYTNMARISILSRDVAKDFNTMDSGEKDEENLNEMYKNMMRAFDKCDREA
jgi:hypothetical protein